MPQISNQINVFSYHKKLKKLELIKEGKPVYRLAFI